MEYSHSLNNVRVSPNLLGETNSSSPSSEDAEVQCGTTDVPKNVSGKRKRTSLTKTGAKRKRVSDVWNHFTIDEEKDTQRTVGICKYCKIAKYDAKSRTGTSNFIRHLGRCREYKKVFPDKISTSGKEIDQQVFRELVAEAVMRHGYSFSWVEHEAIRKIFKYLNANFEPVTRNTVKKDCLTLHASLKEKIKHVLQELPGRICLTSDMWTACTSRGYLCLTAHYIDENWKLHSKLLSFRHCAPPHGGYEISVEIGNVLSEWGIGKKILSLTVDNASNMSRAVSYLKDGVLGNHGHIRCAAHILNLVVHDGLGVIENSISKLRDGIKYIDVSEARKQKFLDLFKNFDVSYSSGLWLDVPTRWNSTYIMIERALKYRDVLDSYFAETDILASKYYLGHDEWEKIEKIFELLEPFYKMTVLFSGSEYPTANLFFPLVFMIHSRIRKALASDDIDIRIAADKMMEKFKKYWHDFVEVLAFAVFFDPRYKWKFVEFAVYGTHGKKEGETLAKDLKSKLEGLYTEYEKSAGPSESSSRKKPSTEMQFNYDQIEEFSLYDPCEYSKSELEIYLDEPRMDLAKDLDVLSYWKGNCTRLPILSSMARDILAIPITTVASESTFSMGGRILNKGRSSLLDENVEALVTTKNWLTGYDDFTEEGVCLKFSSHDSHNLGDKQI